MANITPKPTRMAGANINSGNVNTGEVAFNRGGARAACVYSGAIAMTVVGTPGALGSGGSVLLFSGAGRVNTFNALWPTGVAIAGNGYAGTLSGIGITLYDSAITARSGVFTDATISESGRPIIYAWGPPLVASGININGPGYNPVPVDRPFTSGLCVMALSGSPGFSVTFTPESNTAFN